MSEERRRQLLDELNDAIEELYPIARASNKNMAVFLHQTINKHADEETLEKIIADARRFIGVWGNPSR